MPLHNPHITTDTLAILLIDRTKSVGSSARNIIWANDNYILHDAELYAPASEILPQLVTGANSNIIKPRALKTSELKKQRTKSKAEVFTPTWVVKMQNDAIDENYKQDDVITYINRTWLEITCGEAPYITTRYHMESGVTIPISERVGFLDRKLNRINNEIHDEGLWHSLVKQAYQSSYGFEWNGDSLLLARYNLLNTFLEHYRLKWHKEPPRALIQEIAEIISYNIFQMDGLTLTIPLSKTPTPAKIMDWRAGHMVTFASIG